MAENPLLPNAELRALHTLLEGLTAGALPMPDSEKKRPRGRAGLEAAALLAGTLLQLRPGDLLIPGVNEAPLTRHLLASGGKSLLRQPGPQIFQAESARLLLTAGLAAGLRREAQGGVVLAFCRAGAAEPHWAEALRWVQSDLLPLILVCSDPSGAEAFRAAPGSSPDVLEWRSFSKTAGKLKLAILSVDGEDAVAVYRVMQESILRARSGGGPAVLWAVLPDAAAARNPRKKAQPLARLEHYMETRKITWPRP